MAKTKQALPISTRLAQEEISEIERFAKEENLDKAAFLKKLIRRAFKEYKIKRAFEEYKEGKVTLWKASQLAGLSLWDMIGKMRDYDVYLNYTIKNLREDIKNLRGLKFKE